MDDIKDIKRMLELVLERDNLEDRIMNQENHILETTLKIMILVESDKVDSWAQEIESSCSSITNRMTGSNQYSAHMSFYMTRLFEPFLESYEEYHNTVNNYLSLWEEESDEFYSEYKKDVRHEDDYKKMKIYYKQICILMSSGQVPTKDKILSLLKRNTLSEQK